MFFLTFFPVFLLVILFLFLLSMCSSPSPLSLPVDVSKQGSDSLVGVRGCQCRWECFYGASIAFVVSLLCLGALHCWWLLSPYETYLGLIPVPETNQSEFNEPMSLISLILTVLSPVLMFVFCHVACDEPTIISPYLCIIQFTFLLGIYRGIPLILTQVPLGILRVTSHCVSLMVRPSTSNLSLRLPDSHVSVSVSVSVSVVSVSASAGWW